MNGPFFEMIDLLTAAKYCQGELRGAIRGMLWERQHGSYITEDGAFPLGFLLARRLFLDPIFNGYSTGT